MLCQWGGHCWAPPLLPPLDTSGEDSLSLRVLSVFGSQIAKGSALPGEPTPTLTVGAEGVDTLPALALAGSAASSTDMHFPNGSPGYAVSCSSQEVDVPPKATPMDWAGGQGLGCSIHRALSSHSKDTVHSWF